MDEIDLRILRQLQSDSGRAVQQIADAVGLTVTPCARRIRRLRAEGYVERDVSILNADKLNCGATVFVFVRAGEHSDDWLQKFSTGVSAIPEVQEFHRLSGSIDYLVKLVVADIAHYDDVYKRLIRVAPLADVTSSFAMEKIKDTTELPI